MMRRAGALSEHLDPSTARVGPADADIFSLGVQFGMRVAFDKVMELSGQVCPVQLLQNAPPVAFCRTYNRNDRPGEPGKGRFFRSER